MRNAIDNRRFQDDFAVLLQRDAVLGAGQDVRSESASIYSRSIPSQAMSLPAGAHRANSVLARHRDPVVLASFAIAREATPRANPANTGTAQRGWQGATGKTTQGQRVVTAGKRLGTSCGGAERMSPGDTPGGSVVRLGERRPANVG
ncbi:MAG: hypothetical protein MPJ50_04015 [Pirellulales bacterium]|nr:hypothetical protein [Pirellulales bacterium]